MAVTSVEPDEPLGDFQPSPKASAGRRCRCRPGRKPCPGPIEGFIDPESHQICWFCIACGDNGFISNWENTVWDCRSAQSEPRH